MLKVKLSPEKTLFVLFSITALIILYFWSDLPVKDSAAYLDFADKRFLFGVPHAFDVFSNFSFLLIGLLGLKKSFKLKKEVSFVFFFILIQLSVAIILTAFGSSYFHLNPNLDRLVWDRLPMTIGFSSIVALIIADRISEKLAFYSYLTLLPLGFMSVVAYNQNLITLKPYASIQFGSILFVLLTSVFLKEKRLKNSMIALAIFLYALAKVFETYDLAVLNSFEFLSGHTIKHFLAALAIYSLFCAYKKRDSMQSPSFE